jgi:hypothetical protein
VANIFVGIADELLLDTSILGKWKKKKKEKRKLEKIIFICNRGACKLFPDTPLYLFAIV